jgi:hypothetical protein
LNKIFNFAADLNLFRKLENRTKANRPNLLKAHPHSVGGLLAWCARATHGLTGWLLGSPTHWRSQERSRGGAVLAGGDFTPASSVVALRGLAETPAA